MIFDLSNYYFFILVMAMIYVAISNFAQNNIGGKNRMKELNLELRDVQKKMTEAAKNKNDAEVNELISKNWKITNEVLQVQMKMMVIIIGILFVFMFIFPIFEPGMIDDVKLPLFDDGLLSHCDMAAGDGIFSACYEIPLDAKVGAWTASASLLSQSGELIAKNATGLYVEEGKPTDIWPQAVSKSGFIDKILGATAHTLNVSLDKAIYKRGDKAALMVFSEPSVAEGQKLEATLDSGTFFHIDLPVNLPVFNPLALSIINIQRIIGSYGVFIFTVFLLGIAYSIAKAVYGKIKK